MTVGDRWVQFLSLSEHIKIFSVACFIDDEPLSHCNGGFQFAAGDAFNDK